jgi:hypothetical protein
MQQDRKPEFAIWERPTKNGGTYLSMKTPTGEWITFFKSREKRNPKSPDWYQAQDSQPKQPENAGGEYKFDSTIPF